MKKFIINHLSIFINIIAITIFVIFSTIFVLTNGTHILCSESGNCSLYVTCFSNKPIHQVEFIINNNSKIICKEKVQHGQALTTHLIIQTNNVSNELYHKLGSEECLIYKEILENYLQRQNKTLNYYNQHGSWYHVIFFLLCLIPGYIIGFFAIKFNLFNNNHPRHK